MFDDKEPGNPIEDSSQADGKSVDIGHGEPKDNEEPEMDEAALQEATEKLHREGEARAQALTLELLGDLPHAEVKPPEHVLFVCKLNPVTEGTPTRSTRTLGRLILRNPQTKISILFLAGLEKSCPVKLSEISAQARAFNTPLSNLSTGRTASKPISKCKAYLLMTTAYMLISHKA